MRSSKRALIVLAACVVALLAASGVVWAAGTAGVLPAGPDATASEDSSSSASSLSQVADPSGEATFAPGVDPGTFGPFGRGGTGDLSDEAKRVIDDPRNKGKWIGMYQGKDGRLYVDRVFDKRPSGIDQRRAAKDGWDAAGFPKQK